MRTNSRRPYNEFGLFCWAKGAETGCSHPCLACRGKGFVYDPCDLFSEREERHSCDACGGTGEGTKEACRAAYIDAIQACKAIKAYRKEEVKAIKELGV